MHTNRGLIGVLVLEMLVLASVQVVGAETAQSWRLLGEDTSPVISAKDGIDHLMDINMSKNRSATKTWKDFPTDGTPAWWYAENAAQVNLSFGENNWILYVDHETVDANTSNGTLYADVYKLNSSGDILTHLAGGSISPKEDAINSTITCIDDGSTTQDFNTSEWLALRVNWSCPDYPDEELRIYYYKGDKLSNLTFPSSDPGYPVPELSTLILSSTGLLALAGYVLLTKKRKIKT